jgi:hypothetical protein
LRALYAVLMVQVPWSAGSLIRMGSTCWFFDSSGSNIPGTSDYWKSQMAAKHWLGIWFLLYPFGFGYLKKIPKSRNRWVRVSENNQMPRNSWFWVFKASSKNRWVSWKEPTKARQFKNRQLFAFFKKLRTVGIYNNTKFDFFISTDMHQNRVFNFW